MSELLNLIGLSTGVALYARATFSEGAGTRIDRDENITTDRALSGVAGTRNLVRLRAFGGHSMDRMLAAAADAALPVLHLDADHEIADLWFGLSDVPDWPDVRAKLMGQVEIEESCGAVSVVGDFFGRNAAALAKTRSIGAGVETECGRTTSCFSRSGHFAADTSSGAAIGTGRPAR